MVGVYYRLPDQQENVDELFFLQLQEASHWQALVLLGDFSQPNICWKHGTASSLGDSWSALRVTS